MIECCENGCGDDFQSYKFKLNNHNKNWIHLFNGTYLVDRNSISIKYQSVMMMTGIIHWGSNYIIFLRR